MNEEPKSIWKKSWTGPHWLRAWLMVVAATFFTVLIVTLFIPGGPRSLSDWWPALVFTLLVSVVAATAFVGLWAFIRRFFCWRNFKRFLFGLACFATLVALFYAEEDWRGWHAWQKFKHEWEAKGERFDYASVIPPPVPDDQNFALTPIVASSYEMFFDKSGHEIQPRNTNVIDRLSMITWRDNHWAKIPKLDGWQASKKSDLKAWQAYFRSPPPTNSVETNSFPVTPQPQSPADDILLALSKYDSAIEEIRQASQLPYSRFPLTYNEEDPAVIPLPHLNALRSCVQALNLRALADLQNGRSEKALADVKLSLRLADSIRTEPCLISHLVRIAMVNLTLQPMYEGLVEHKWSEAQLVELDSELAKLDFLPDYGTAVRGDMGCQKEIIDYLRRHPEQFPNLSAYGDFIKAPLLARIIWHSIPSGWFYQNQLRCSRFMIQQYLPLADLEHRIVSPASVRHADAAVGLEFRHVSPYNRLESLLLPAFGGAVKKFAYAQTSVDLARVAIALERYRLAHGGYPESLDALAPQFIAKIPHDIINGQPLHYRPETNGQFVLYSVGWNEADDGGEVGRIKYGTPDISEGDWVWRYPAK
jgi:tetratricopeptide (TPR) repeat protein